MDVNYIEINNYNDSDQDEDSEWSSYDSDSLASINEGDEPESKVNHEINCEKLGDKIKYKNNPIEFDVKNLGFQKQHVSSIIDSPLDYFCLIFDYELFHKIIEYTNLYATNRIDNN